MVDSDLDVVANDGNQVSGVKTERVGYQSQPSCEIGCGWGTDTSRYCRVDERHPPPGDVGDVVRGRRWCHRLPIDQSDNRTRLREDNVWRADIVVTHDLPAGTATGRESPSSIAAGLIVRHCTVVVTNNADELAQGLVPPYPLGPRLNRGHHAFDVAENLASLVIYPEIPRRVREPNLFEIQQQVANAVAPWSNRSPNRVADLHDPRVAAASSHTPILADLVRGLLSESIFGCWRRLGRPVLPLIVQRAHQSHVIAIGINDDGVTSAPEGVVRRLCPAIASASQLGVPVVDVFSGRDPEPNNDSRLLASPPGRVVEPGKVLVVDVDLDLAELEVRVPDLSRRAVVDLHSQPPIEGDCGVVVMGDKIDKIEFWANGHVGKSARSARRTPRFATCSYAAPEPRSPPCRP